MMRTVTAVVLRPNVTGTDRMGMPVYGKPTRECVHGVLVSPSTTADMDADRPEGTTAALTMHVPKGYTASLDGCKVKLPPPWAGTYRVVGDPQPYMAANTPGPWNRPVGLEVAHG
jgi:hypothetical protein